MLYWSYYRMLFNVLLVGILHCGSIESALVKDFSFASYYADHMVLQGAPKQAVLWGYGDATATIDVTVNNEDKYSTAVDAHGKWIVKIGPYNVSKSGKPNTITAKQHPSSSNETEIYITDVLFGEVWLCSGQSNMELGMNFVYNSSVEMKLAMTYSNIRLLHVGRTRSEKPEEDLSLYFTQWTKPSKEAFNTSVGFGGFSAVCMLYGMRLYDKFEIPLGMIQSSFGGSIIEAWSSQHVLDQCPLDDATKNWSEPPSVWTSPPTHLWNSMIAPLCNMTIQGVIWYQGESNCWIDPDAYSCIFPKMIEDWRKTWFEGSKETTDKLFPFGFVQFGGYNPIPYDKWAEVRWHQTADFGFVPNEEMPNTFMAVGTDLTDILSPVYNSGHTRDKQTVADRLSWAAFNLVYGMTEYPVRGPQVVKTYFNRTETQDILILKYDQDINVKSNDIFSFNCTNGGWKDALVAQFNTTDTLAILLPEHCAYYQFAYLWKQTPCIYKLCSIYATGEYQLPSPTWIWTYETLQNPQKDEQRSQNVEQNESMIYSICNKILQIFNIIPKI